MVEITPEVKQKLNENFDITKLLDAIDQLDTARTYLNKQEKGTDNRDKIIHLCSMLHKVLNEGYELYEGEDLWELTNQVKKDIEKVKKNTDRILNTLNELSALAPNQ